MTKLSICIPTYNRAAFLGELLDSFLSQFEDGMEIVISDNASTDGTEALVTDYKRRHPSISIVYYRWPQNMGADLNYRKVVELATGEYCWLFGSDDTVPPGAVRKVAEMLNEHSDIYLFNRTEWTYEMRYPMNTFLLDKTAGARVYRFSERAEIDEYLQRAKHLNALFGYLSSIVVRRAAWHSVPYDERYTGTAYSHAFALMSLVHHGCTLHYDPRPLVNARLGNDSFAVRGRAKRILLDFDGYGAIRDQVFADDARAQTQINNILQRSYPWYMLARDRIEMTADEWDEILRALRRVHCPWGKMFGIQSMRHCQMFLRVYIWAKLCIARRKLKRW